MYVITGLPSDYRVESPSIQSIFIPDFPVQNLDSLFEIADKLVVLDQQVYESNREYMKYSDKLTKLSKEKLQDKYMILLRNLEWKESRYEANNISVVYEALLKEYNAFKSSMLERTSGYEKVLKKRDICNKEIKGTLREIDVLHNEYDFLAEHYIIVPKALNIKFTKFIEQCAQLSKETLKVIMEDGNDKLYCITGLKKEAEASKKMIIDAGFHYKQTYNEEEYKQRKLDKDRVFAEYESAKTNLILYLESNINELIMIYLHVKALRLYIEAVLIFGINKNNFYAIQGENRQKIMLHWMKNLKKHGVTLKDMTDDDYLPVVVCNSPFNDNELPE